MNRLIKVKDLDGNIFEVGYEYYLYKQKDLKLYAAEEPKIEIIQEVAPVINKKIRKGK